MDADDDRIRLRAYELWQREGSPHGRHDDHWAEAVRELSGDAAPAKPAKAAVRPRATAKTATQSETAAPKKAAAAKKPLAAKSEPVATPKAPPKRRAKSPLADAGAPGGTGGTGGTAREQDA